MPSVAEITKPESAAAPTWDLESIFPGGSDSAEYKKFCDQIGTDLESVEKEATSLPREWNADARDRWRAFVVKIQDIASRLDTAGSFAGCLVAQNVDDEAAHAHEGRVDVYHSRWLNLRTTLEEFALALTDAQWQEFLDADDFAEIRFYLNEVRDRAKEKMPPELEKLAQELAVNGYHAWNRLYDKMAGDLRVDFEVDGETKRISLGQLAMYMSNADRKVRQSALSKLEGAWETQANLAAMALNAQGGFRLSLYKNRGWDSYLQEPLARGRLQKGTLDAMWAAVADGVPKLVPFVDAKKKLLGIDKFCWYDQTAPVGGVEKKYTFAEAGEFVVRQLADFSPEMAEFTEMAIRKNWVEAENRGSKGAGAFCTDFPTHRMTRVFMTWGGEYDHLMTLAHELGHAYHAWVLRDAPYLATSYPMNLAETASTFNELRVTDAALKATEETAEKLMLLNQKLSEAVVMFCNLRARFFFDCSFYEERANGMVPRARLDELMIAAQRKAFSGMLADPDGYHPLFWASKLHFYITGYPFYNFPYVFGFLFANGVYDRAQKEGEAFAQRYHDLLADTGKMTTEELARRHLNVDLTNRTFWDDAVGRVVADVKPFVESAAGA